MSDATSSTPVKTCDNCKRDISEANFVIHTVHCHRNIVLCKKCDTPFPKDEIEEHDKESHSKVSCTKCGLEIEQQTLEDHRASKCSKRMMVCGFCDIEVPFEDHDEHEDYCGSRTERCDECGQYVMVKFVDIHLNSNHSFLTLEDATKPQKNKLNNVKDEITVQESASSRFNPGKRTNDMPQINLDREVEKNLDYKPVLQAASSSPPKLSMEETDRLLALQVANEDSDEQNEDVLNAFYRDDPIPNRDQHNFYTGLNTFPAVPPAPFSEPPAAVSTLARMSSAIGTSINHLFPDATSERREKNEGTDDISLPCEFCGDLLPVDALLQHQATCENGDEDFGYLLNPEPTPLNNTRNSPEPIVRGRVQPLLDQRQPNPFERLPVAAIVDSTRGFTVPCEYCHELYDSSLINEHQNLCAETNREQRVVNQRVLPPRFGEPFLRPAERLQRQQVNRDAMLFRDGLGTPNLAERAIRLGAVPNLRDYGCGASPTVRENRFGVAPTVTHIVRDVPIAVPPGYNPNPVRQAQLEDVEKENALRQLRRLKAQMSNADAPLVTSRRFAEPTVVTQRNNGDATGGQPDREATMGQTQRDPPMTRLFRTLGNPHAYDEDYRRQTSNRPPPTMNRRNI